MRLLIESKRDNLLLPYMEIMNKHNEGKPLSLGEVKSKLLNRFQAFGGFSNLSLASNYYLAGVARYYFNGDLTVNKDLGIFDDSRDEWNEDVCRRLNALILILRNGIIDSVGEKFEQPEDFGELSLPKLLRKYGAKINDVLGVKKEKAEVEVQDRLNRNPSVGKGDYTFEIMYSYEDCRKYYKYTNPGAWCITYGEMHYSGYIKRLNIHYVIFRKEGFENVPRKTEREMWKTDRGLPKPQDTYGNSLIALLQSNVDGEPVYITSRWNHGYPSGNNNNGDYCPTVEADHAYSKEEFMQITGVSDADLQRIFEIWKKDKPSKTRTSEEKKEEKEEKLKALRTLKYSQMRLNGGEGMMDVFKPTDNNPYPLMNVIVGDASKGKPNKCIIDVSADIDDRRWHFLVDRGKILFETMLQEGRDYSPYNSYQYSEKECGSYPPLANAFHDVILVKLGTNCTMIYNVRLHQFLEIEGLKKFKHIEALDNWWTKNSPFLYYEIKEANRKTALVDAKTNIPLKLPNGSYWFEYWTSNVDRFDNNERGTVSPSVIRGSKIIVITYDSSAGIQFYFSPKEKRFLNIDVSQGSGLVSAEWGKNEEDLGDFSLFRIGHWNNSSLFYRLTDKEGNIIEINGINRFSDVKVINNNIIAFCPYESGRPRYSQYHEWQIFNIDTKTIVGYNGQPLVTRQIQLPYGGRESRHFDYIICYETSSKMRGLMNSGQVPGSLGGLKIMPYRAQGSEAFIYSIRDDKFLINPYTNSLWFYIEDNHDPEWNNNNVITVYKDIYLGNAEDVLSSVVQIDLDELRNEGRMAETEDAVTTITKANEESENAESQSLAENKVKISLSDIKQMVNESIRIILKSL